MTSLPLERLSRYLTAPVRACQCDHELVALNPVQRRVLRPQVRQQRLVAERPAGHAPAQHAGAVALPVPVNLLVEPPLEAAELAAAEVGVEVAEVAPRLLHELRRVQVAQRVRREVAEAAEAPVDVLQAALPVVRRRQA